MIVDNLRKSVLENAFKGELIKNYTEIKNECNDEYIENQKKALAIKNVVFKKVKKENSLDNLYSIPENWVWVKLGNIVYNWGQKTPQNDFSYIDISSIDNKNHKLSDDEKIISSSKAPSRARKIVKKGDIIYSTVRPYLHNMAIINKDFSKELIASTGFAVLHCIDCINNKYLFYYLMSPFFDSYANSNENAVGIAYPAINDEKLYNSFVPVPPLEEQSRIVEKIEQIFGKLEEIEPIENEIIELKSAFPIDFKNSIINESISGNFVCNKKNELKVIESNYSSAPYAIPENWSWVKINDVLNIQTGLSFKKTDQCKKGNDCIRILRGGNINNNYQYELKDDDVYVKGIDSYEKLQCGDILTPAVTSMEQMGKVAYIDKELNNITAGGFVYIIRSKNFNILNPKFALYFINSKFHKEMCKPNIHKSGQAFYNLKK